MSRSGRRGCRPAIRPVAGSPRRPRPARKGRPRPRRCRLRCAAGGPHPRGNAEAVPAVGPAAGHGPARPRPPARPTGSTQLARELGLIGNDPCWRQVLELAGDHRRRHGRRS